MPKNGSMTKAIVSMGMKQSALLIFAFYIRFERFDLFQDKFRADNNKPRKKNNPTIDRVEKRLLNAAAENAR